MLGYPLRCGNRTERAWGGSRLSLSSDPTRGSLSGEPTLPSLLKEMSEGGKADGGKSVLVGEGIPPLPIRVVEAICRWEHVELGTLLMVTSPKPEELVSTQAQIVVVPSVDQLKRRRRRLWTLPPGVRHSRS